MPTASRSPSLARVVVGLALLLSFVGAMVGVARSVADDPTTASRVVLSISSGVLGFLAIASLYEWLVHRYLYHRPSVIRLCRSIYEVHQRGHHWHRFPPNRYVHSGPVERIPIWPPAPYQLCGSRHRRAIAWLGQFVLYVGVAIPFALLPAWLATGNWLFTTSATLTGLAVSYLLIHVHDAIHYPAGRWIEQQRWFQFLDRHHYLHHVDTRINVNFLLPLSDWLFGTLTREATAAEQARWPSFEAAKRPPP